MSGDGRAAIEAALTEALDAAPASLREPCRRIAEAGGERLRAGLVLAVAGRAWPGTSRRTATAAAAVELLHLATLVRDDLLADAPVRGGAPTVNAKEGPAVALLTADVLTGLATRLAALAGAGTLLADTLVEICAGQALEADHRLRGGLTAATALRVAELRTGTMVATAARLGALVTGAPEDGLREFGLAAGTALHLLDDALDLITDGSSAACSAVTLPAVHALAAHPELRPLLRPGLAGDQRDRALELLRTGVRPTLATATGLLAQAAAARPDLADLPARHRGSRLALVLPRYRALLSS